jgi:hypothetical protein
MRPGPDIGTTAGPATTVMGPQITSTTMIRAVAITTLTIMVMSIRAG